MKETSINNIKLQLQDEEALPFQRKTEKLPSHQSERLSQMDEAELAAREKKKQEIASVNSVQGIINDHKDATHRYTIDPQRSGREEKKTERSQNNPNY